MDYLRYFDKERYLFEDVHRHFRANHFLDAFDFFSIIIWKANRAKTKIAKKLLKGNPCTKASLEAACRTLTQSLFDAADRRARFRVLIEDWRFALPMASAILTVCWPDEFTIYDYRVRELIGELPKVHGGSSGVKKWEHYEAYITGVVQFAPQKSLRDKDRYLSGHSKADELKSEIRRCFDLEVD